MSVLVLAAVMAARDFAPLQHRAEFTQFMHRVAELAPATAVEIGCGIGMLYWRP